MPIAPGTRIGSYEIQAPLGEGGMGAVYKAHDPTLRRTVAIKVLAKQDEDASARLLQEARAASALNHPHICTIHEVGEHEGQAFIVMEHVEGKPLSALIPSDGLPPESVIRYGTQIADALAHAHERGIVHRDLKSQNVVITPEGRAKVLDFGLAARMPQADVEAVTKTQEAIPHAGMLVGTLAYMPPEVLRGEAATARSDIWALGVLLYEMASGRVPFGGKTVMDLASAIVRESPTSLTGQVSAGFRAIVQHCMAKEPGQRYGTAAEARAALETVQSDSGTQPADIAPMGAVRSWRTAAAVVGFVLVAGMIGYWLRSQAPDTSTSTVPRLTNPVQVTRAIGQEMYPTWSPDESRLAFESGETSPTGYDIWVAQLGGGEPVNLTADHAGDDRYPSWSPEGSDIAFLSQRNDTWGLYAVPAVGGSPRRLSSLPGIFAGTSSPQWSTDGTEIALVVRDQGDYVVEVVTVQTQETRRIPLPGGIPQPAMLAWSPDGRFFVYSDQGPSFEMNRLWLVPSSGGEPIPLTDSRSNDLNPSWSADSQRLFFISNRGGAMDLWQQRIDTEGQPDGEAQRLTTGIEMASAVFSRDGTRLAYARGRRFQNSNVWRVPLFPDRPATWADAEQLTFEDNGYFQGMELSPDGERLVFASDRNGNQDLWMLSTSGGPPTQLTTDPAGDWFPAWSPDGEQIAFQAGRSGNRDIWVMPADGGPARQLTTHPAREMAPRWSPDGREIVFSSMRSGNNGVWIVPAEGGEPRQVTAGPRPGVFPRWSPDGTSIIVSGGNAAGSPGTRRIPLDGGEPEDLGFGFGRISPDGRTRSNGRAVDGGRQWFIFPLPDGPERLVVDLVGRPGRSDGRAMGNDFMYFSWGQRRTDIWVMDVVTDDGSDD